MRILQTSILVLFLCAGAICANAATDSSGDLDVLIGVWTGTATYNGDSADLTLRFEKNEKGEVTATFDMLKTNIRNVPLGAASRAGDLFKAAVFEFRMDPAAGAITGEFGQRKIPFQLKKDAPSAVDSRLGPPVRNGKIAWTFPTAGPIWSSPAVADHRVYFGSNDGNFYALDARNGKQLWKHPTGKPILGRPTLHDGTVLMVSDNGFLYKLDAKSGKEIWKFDTGGGTVARSPAGNGEGNNYDFFTSAPVIVGGRVFVGSASKHFYALDEKTGKEAWRFEAGNLIRSTAVVAEGLVIFGSWDHFVYALDEKTGALKWKVDTADVVTSSPVYENGVVYIGSRSANVFALKASTGDIIWKYFYWFSWVESTGALRDGILYVGSSDYQALVAIDTKTGTTKWNFDTDGSAWSSPATTPSDVYIGTAGTVGYMADHRGAFFAVNRADGKEKWRVTFEPIKNEFCYGVVSSPAVADGLVFFGGLDGKFYAVNSD